MRCSRTVVAADCYAAPLSARSRRQQSPAKIAVRHTERETGACPPEPAREARRLLRPFGDRSRSRTEVASVRSSEEDGARAVQAVHLSPPRTARPLHNDQAGKG